MPSVLIVPAALLYKTAEASPKLMPVEEVMPAGSVMVPDVEGVFVAFPKMSCPLVKTLKIFDEVAIVKSEFAAGVPVAIESDPEEFRRNLVAPFN